MIEIPLPPIAPVLGEQPAIIEPALRDLPAFSGMEVSDPVRVEVEDVDDGEWLVLEREAVEVAFADDRVRRALADRHHTVIGTSRMSGKEGQDWALTLVAFCYEDGLTYEVAMRAGTRFRHTPRISAKYTWLATLSLRAGVCPAPAPLQT